MAYHYIQIAYDDSLSGDLFDEIFDLVHDRTCDGSAPEAPEAPECGLIHMSSVGVETLDELYAVMDGS